MLNNLIQGPVFVAKSNLNKRYLLKFVPIIHSTDYLLLHIQGQLEQGQLY